MDAPLWPIPEQSGGMNPAAATKELLEKSRSFFIPNLNAMEFVVYILKSSLSRYPF